MMMTLTRKYLLSSIPEKVRDALDAEALLVLPLGGVRGGGGRVEEAGHVVGDGLEAVALGVRRLPGAQHRGHPGYGHWTWTPGYCVSSGLWGPIASMWSLCAYGSNQPKEKIHKYVISIDYLEVYNTTPRLIP